MYEQNLDLFYATVLIISEYDITRIPKGELKIHCASQRVVGALLSSRFFAYKISRLENSS